MSDPEFPSVPAGEQDARVDRARRSAWLDRQLQPHTARYRALQFCAVSAGWLLVPQALAIAVLVQQVFVQRDGLPSRWLGVLVVVVLLRLVLTTLAQWLAAQLAEAVRARLRTRLAWAVQARGPLWMRGQRSAALAELSVGHVDALDGYYSGYLAARTECLWVPAVLALAVLVANWVAGLLLLFTAPLIPLFMVLVGWGAEAAGREQLQALTRAGAHFADRLRGLDLIRAYGRAQRELAGVAAAADDLRDRTMRVLRMAFLSSAVLEFFASVGVAMVALYFGFHYLGLLKIGPTPVTLGIGMFCLLLAPEFYAPLRRLAAHYHDRANALAAVAQIEEVLGGLPQMQEASSAGSVQDNAPQSSATPIRAQGMALRHPGAASPVLERLDFLVPVGERLALIGASGSGKSSLLEAIAGWLPPEQGQLWVDPTAKVVLAGQRPWLFHGSIADNIRLGDPGADPARVQAAADAAQVSAFARRLPDGLDTLIGERGFGLSGGEARRVGLARALLYTPDILLLDEPTAFLDPDTEARLLQALDAFAHGRTVVVATHSPAVIAWAGTTLDVGAHAGKQACAGDPVGSPA